LKPAAAAAFAAAEVKVSPAPSDSAKEDALARADCSLEQHREPALAIAYAENTTKFR